MDKELENVIFESSVVQLKFAEIYLNYTEKKTLQEIAKEIHITYKTIWTWFQDKNFVDWLNSKKNELLNKSLTARYKTSIRKAEAGDFQFSKMLFEMTGDYRQRTEIGGIDDKPVNIKLIPVITKEDVKDLEEND